MNILHTSTEYVRVPVSATKNGIAYDPTSDAVYMAFIIGYPQPSNADWHVASWENASGTHYAICLVGPSGGVNLPPGTYNVYVKVTDNPEVPVRDAGPLVVE